MCEVGYRIAACTAPSREAGWKVAGIIPRGDFGVLVGPTFRVKTPSTEKKKKKRVHRLEVDGNRCTAWRLMAIGA